MAWLRQPPANTLRAPAFGPNPAEAPRAELLAAPGPRTPERRRVRVVAAVVQVDGPVAGGGPGDGERACRSTAGAVREVGRLARARCAGEADPGRVPTTTDGQSYLNVETAGDKLHPVFIQLRGPLADVLEQGFPRLWCGPCSSSTSAATCRAGRSPGCRAGRGSACRQRAWTRPPASWSPTGKAVKLAAFFADADCAQVAMPSAQGHSVVRFLMTRTIP